MSLAPTKPAFEVKLMERHSKCDINAMLFYVFYLLHIDEDVILEPDFERNFISKCMYCGCIPKQSGKDISYFGIPKVSFAIFAYHIKQYFQKDPDCTKNRLEHIIIETLKALQSGLRSEDGKKFEQVIIYDEKCTKLVRLKRILQNPASIKTFTKTILKLISWGGLSRIHRQSDDLSRLYNTINAIHPEKELNIFYALYEDIHPIVPSGIEDKFSFCTRTYRKTYEFCVTKEYVKDNIDNMVNRDYIDLNNVLFENFYNFVGLSAKK